MRALPFQAVLNCTGTAEAWDNMCLCRVSTQVPVTQTPGPGQDISKC